VDLTRYPSLLDPIYRLEVRRYWTWRRYCAAAAVVAAWWALALAVYFLVLGNEIPRKAHFWRLAVPVIWLWFVGRFPLCFMAATGTALAVSSERASGVLEQLVLTSIDSRRYFTTRYMSRLHGLFFFWLATACASVFGAIIVQPDAYELSLGQFFLILALIFLAQVDLAVLIMIDGAVGFRLGSEPRPQSAVLARTYAVAFLFVPAVLLMTVVLVGLLVGGCLGFGLVGEEGVYLVLALMVAARLSCAWIMLRGLLRDAQGAADRVLFQPDGA
jgi:hypothetical protein